MQGRGDRSVRAPRARIWRAFLPASARWNPRRERPHRRRAAI